MTDLDDIFVVSLEHAVAAPYASCKLADAGARVVKVEGPNGDFARNYDNYVNGESAYFVWINRGKESICLNLKNKDDYAILFNMLSQADVFLQNLAPGAFERLGFSYDEIREINPRLITCAITGYGSEGPYKDQKAYDLLIQAETGLSSINGTPEGIARVGVSVCDIAAGMTAYQSILQGLIGRQKTGLGRDIEVSLFNAMADWMNVPYLQYKYGDKLPERMGLKHPTIAPYGAFSCADGKYILISIQNDREWEIFCELVLEEPELAIEKGWSTNIERVKNRQIVDAKIGEYFSKHDRETSASILENAKIAFGRLSDLEDLVNHPQNRFISVMVNGEEIKLFSPGAVIQGQVDSVNSIPEKNRDETSLRNEFSKPLEVRMAGE